MEFSVDFTKRATIVLQEAFKLKKYKAMPLFLAIPVGIFMLPLIVISLVLSLFVYILGYLFSVVSLPVQRLHTLLREEGQVVNDKTQIIVYLLSWALVFAAYAFLAVSLIALTVTYTLFSISTYLWTLGGFKFHALAKDEDISIEVTGKYPIWLPIIFIAVMLLLLLVLPLIQTVSDFIDIYKDVEITFDWFMEWFPETFKEELHETDNIRFLFSALYSAFLLAPGPKKKVEE